MNPKTKAFIDEWGVWIYRLAIVVIGLMIVAALFEIAGFTPDEPQPMMVP